jgi:uncharacterized protein YndB with AHSA1/START domain
MNTIEVDSERVVAERRILVSSSPEHVFSSLLQTFAITEPRVGASIDIQPAWAFQIRSTRYGAEITEFEPNQSLAFGADFRGHKLLAKVSVEPHELGSAVSWAHSLPADADGSARYAVIDYAEAFLYNLRSRAETGQEACSIDEPTEAVRLEVTIDAAPDDAFRALTDPTVLNQWIGENAAVDLRVGGDYDYGWRSEDGMRLGPIQLQKLEQGREVTHSWNHGEAVDTVVSWTIEGQGGGTTLKLTHSGFGSDEELPNYTLGWASILCAVKALLEGKPRVTKA